MSEQNQQPASSNPADASGIDNHFRDMGEKYLGWAKADVARIEDLIRGLRATPSDAEAIEQVFKVAHGIKGQGSTFGYELMTEVGQVLSEYLKKRPNPLTADQLNIIEQHARDEADPGAEDHRDGRRGRPEARQPPEGLGRTRQRRLGAAPISRNHRDSERNSRDDAEQDGQPMRDAARQVRRRVASSRACAASGSTLC